MARRIVGIDLGAETIKLVELGAAGEKLEVLRRLRMAHGKEPEAALSDLTADWDLCAADSIMATGRFSRLLAIDGIPQRQALAAGVRYCFGKAPVTVVSIGGHGFSVLELRANEVEVYRENSRCSQGTGNFLRQLVERFGLTVEEASRLCEQVDAPAPLSGRCPVILKTDMTHLANRGEDQARILAGLYDAVCENVQVLIKPRSSPKRVVLSGGVTRSVRVRERFRRFLSKAGMELVGWSETSLFYEAIGCALEAAAGSHPAPESLFLTAAKRQFHSVPGLRDHLPRVTRLVAAPSAETAASVILGLDIGSTGSKAVLIPARGGASLWEGYGPTGGKPVAAAQELVRRCRAETNLSSRVVAFGVTGSGREIVGSLLASCYGAARVYIMNEIAAHAEGALHFDRSVDTIFEIGGQDAKYIRLSGGRVVDAAMNEACSAGTGSFIEEQGKRFAGIDTVEKLGEQAIAAESGVALGQHCSVFMAEIIDEAVAAGREQSEIVAGIYDSIIRNYMDRVKGSRTVGSVIFCQGMPFAADALAAAVARLTDSRVVVPPNPGTVGAFGIALLASRMVSATEPADLGRFLEAKVLRKDRFVCKATRGCGEPGSRCRIDRIATRVEETSGRFTWGGACSLWDRGTGKQKLPDLAPDPFRERRQAMAALASGRRGSGPVVAMTDQFQLAGLLPFFVAFFEALGCGTEVVHRSDGALLKRGIEQANIPYCAPMQQYHGIVGMMAETRADYLFLPMLRSLRRVDSEPNSVLCPVVQGSSDILRWDLADDASRFVAPCIDFGLKGLRSPEFLDGCRRIVESIGGSQERLRDAVEAGIATQDAFDRRLLDAGREALAFCRDHSIIPVVVLGRPYTIHSDVLNSNVPALLREQGAIPIPVDCYPVESAVPVFEDIYWGYGQRSLRAAYQIRRTEGVYSVWCSNYSCGPDSFSLHFYHYSMEGKPYAVIETDGHSGDAGTKTRLEAFLHCVRGDLAGGGEARPEGASLLSVARTPCRFDEVRERKETFLFPRMGPATDGIAACLRGVSVPAEGLDLPSAEDLVLGKRYTSGKECLPMCVTLGSLLKRLRADGGDRRYVLFMPSTVGPCRFGVYNNLFRIILDRLGEGHRVRIWSPLDSDYFEGLPQGFSILMFSAICSLEMLQAAYHHVRPVATDKDAADRVYEEERASLVRLIERAGSVDLSLPVGLFQVSSGRLFGCSRLLSRAAKRLADLGMSGDLPTVSVVGEIYVRSDPFSNDFLVKRLWDRGIRARLAPVTEWLEYTDLFNRLEGSSRGFGKKLKSLIKRRVLDLTYQRALAPLGFRRRSTVQSALDAASPFIRKELPGEAILTLGEPLHEWREGEIDGVINVGPLECMPTKVAEAQFFHVAETDNLLSLTIPFNGDPLDPEVLDSFVYEVKRRYARRRRGCGEERRQMEA